MRAEALRQIASFRSDVYFALIDAFLVVTMYVAAVGIRLLDSSTENIRGVFSFGLIRTLPFIVLVHLLAGLVFGTYGHMWEFASIAEARRIAWANLAAVTTVLIAVETYRLSTGSLGPIPMGSIVLAGLLTLMATGMVRFRSRLFSFRRADDGRMKHQQRMIVVGVNRQAVDAVRRIEAADPTIDVVGFVSSDENRNHRIVAGRAVLGAMTDLSSIIREEEIDQVLVVGGDDDLARRVLDHCIFNDARLRILPDVDSVLRDKRGAVDIRDLQITDLLPRPVVATDMDEVAALINGSRVLVTGAGGSIGSEIVRQVQMFEPESVYALDNDETHLHDAGLQWAARSPRPVPVLCDVRDTRRLARLVGEISPTIVFHAAALKHVPILEDNPEEAVRTNVLGTQNLIDAALAVEVSHFVLISTDKAVEPVNVMGASKRVAEHLVYAADRRGPGAFRAVRFGNVLGSRGSVVPTFVRQIQAGGPVTITEPEMTRYFMTIHEACQLVLQATALGDADGVYVLDMGEPVMIADLAHRLIRLSGLVPGRDIEIQVTGRRAGEKLTEKLSSEPLSDTGNPKIHLARPHTPPAFDAANVISALIDLSESHTALRELLFEVAGLSDGPVSITVDLDEPAMEVAAMSDGPVSITELVDEPAMGLAAAVISGSAAGR